MSGISELEQRITAALERISSGLGGLASAAVADEKAGEIGALNQALEAEKNANTKLEERVNAIKDKQENSITQLEGKTANLGEQLAILEADCKRLVQVNAQLRDNNTALRAANEKGVGDADLINAGLKGELDSLRAERTADLGEMKAIMSELAPLIGEGV